MLLKDFPSTYTDCNLVSVSSESLNENHLFEKYSVTDSLSNMVEKGYFIGDSLLFTAITIGVIGVFGIFLLAVVIWVCTEFICTENWRNGQALRTLSIRARGMQNVEAITNPKAMLSNKTGSLTICCDQIEDKPIEMTQVQVQ